MWRELASVQTNRVSDMSDLLYGMEKIGCKDGMTVFVSRDALAQKGASHCAEALGIVKRWPVKTDLSGNIVMVRGITHQDAVDRYLGRVDAI
jgi:hypothetical protein